jgi:hypothetical protein
MPLVPLCVRTERRPKSIVIFCFVLRQQVFPDTWHRPSKTRHQHLKRPIRSLAPLPESQDARRGILKRPSVKSKAIAVFVLRIHRHSQLEIITDLSTMLGGPSSALPLPPLLTNSTTFPSLLPESPPLVTHPRRNHPTSKMKTIGRRSIVGDGQRGKGKAGREFVDGVCGDDDGDEGF